MTVLYIDLMEVPLKKKINISLTSLVETVTLLLTNILFFTAIFSFLIVHI